jgi:hypothetical protein
MPSVGGWWRHEAEGHNALVAPPVGDESGAPEYDTHVLVQMIDSVDEFDVACEKTREEITEILNDAYKGRLISQFSYSMTFQQVRADFPRGNLKRPR